MIPKVNRILPRRSGTLNALRKADSMRDSLDDFHGAARGGDLLGRRRREGVRPHLQRDRDLAAAEHLHRRALAGEALADHRLRVDAALRQGGGEPLHVHHRPAHLVRVGEAPQLGHAPLQRHLAALEADTHPASGAGALGAPAGGLALAGGLAPALAGPGGGRTGCRAQMMQLHSFTSSTSIRWETFLSMPRISGRSSLTTTSPRRLRPRPRTVARWSGGRPIRERFWVTLSRTLTRRPPCPRQAPPPPRRPAAGAPPWWATSRPARGRASWPAPPGA